MKALISALVLIFTLAACNMTTATSLNNGSAAVALLTNTPVTPPPTTIPTQTPAPTQVPVATNVVPAQNSVRNIAVVSPSCTVKTDWATYTVVAGDTLSRIAQLVPTTVENLQAANCLTDVNSLNVGQQIYVPVPIPGVGGQGETGGNLRLVGDFMGAPDLSGCWASSNGTQALVYDAIGGKAFAMLINRVPVTSATDSGWAQVYIEGTKTLAQTTGWMKISEVSLLGACTETTGIQLDSFRGEPFGNPAGVPDGVCAVVPGSPDIMSNFRAGIFENQDGSGFSIGIMTGWARWVQTQGDLYQAEFTTTNNTTFLGWVDSHLTYLVNC